MTEHVSKHYLYRTWVRIRSRCYDKNHHKYPRYGGRGLTVSDAWLSSFQTFLNDMGDRPPGYSIDRINNDLGYSKENCRWASARTQTLNRSTRIQAKGYYINKLGRYVATFKDSLGKKRKKLFKTAEEAHSWYLLNRPTT